MHTTQTLRAQPGGRPWGQGQRGDKAHGPGGAPLRSAAPGGRPPRASLLGAPCPSASRGLFTADGRHRALVDEAAASPWRRALEGGCVRAARPSLLPPLFLGPGHRGCCCRQWQRSLNPPPRLRTQGWKAARHPRPYPQTPTAEGLSRTQGAACRTHGQGQ